MPAFFLRTKLLPPRPAPALLPRPRLIERLQANLVHPVTLVTANAGSGKTTLVADFVRTHAHQYLWYQLDHTDADPFVFLGYLAHGIKQHVAEFGAATFAYLQEAAAEVAQQPERAVDVLLNEVLDLVDELRTSRRLTVVSTMHDLTLAGQYADRLVMLSEGRVVARGDAADVLTEANVARYYGARVRVLRDTDGIVVVPVRPVQETVP